MYEVWIENSGMRVTSASQRLPIDAKQLSWGLWKMHRLYKNILYLDEADFEILVKSGIF